MRRLTRYQWLVLFAAWLGWGFDIFDSLLFNFVAPNCVPTLLHVPLGTPEAMRLTGEWTGTLTSLLLLGWAVGGLLFGPLCDRWGRTRVLMLTMLVYAVGTAACAFVPSIGWLVACRLIASLGIGGEWAAGASLVAEVMPEERRLEAGALLYSASPVGIVLATAVNYLVAGVWWAHDPARAWRYVFLLGLAPALVAFATRAFLAEPPRWQQAASAERAGPSWVALFAPERWRVTVWATIVAVIALTSWWSCNAFLPALATGLARSAATARGLAPVAAQRLAQTWVLHTSLIFDIGGLIGVLLTVPIAKRFGRRAMFGGYFAASAAAILLAFGLPLPATMRLAMFFFIGLSVFGVFGAFTYYLPELFPTRLRASGSGFCYNIGRVLAAPGPLLVGAAARHGLVEQALFYVGVVPLTGALLSPLFIETRGRALSD